MNCSLGGWNLRKNNAEWWFSPQAITRETVEFFKMQLDKAAVNLISSSEFEHQLCFDQCLDQKSAKALPRQHLCDS